MARLIVLLAATGLLQAQNWPMFRGSGASGVADGQNLPNHWNVESSENVLWKTAIPGMGHSSPVIWGNGLFVTTALSSDPSSVFQTKTTGQIDRRSDASRHTWRLFSINKETGKILWQKKVYEGEPRIHRHPKNSYASATPATDGKYVVAMFGCYPSRSDLAGSILTARYTGNKLAKMATVTSTTGAIEKLTRSCSATP